MKETLDTQMLDTVLAGCKTPQDVDVLYSQLLQRVINRSLDAEMEAHLGYSRHAKQESGRRANGRNGSTRVCQSNCVTAI
mgnify:CR=1 FL=1